MQKTRMIFGGHSLKFLFFAAVLSFFAVRNVSARDESSERSVINIESAQKTEYKKDSEKGTDTIVLTGNVRISVSRGNKKTTITADTVNYNRATDMLYAEGNVSLEQSSGSSGGESITADSLLFNTSTLEGIFDNGRAVQTSSDAINLPSGSTLIVASDIFGRDSGGTIAFKTGELTFCDDEDPHWKIRASRIWLLPGGEFAFLNATLYVGRIPLLWFPAFYYPKDELVFNPAFGYKARPGYFVNTTTYLYGRKNPSDTSSKSSSSDDDDKINFFSFMKTGAMKEQVREGLVLHNLDEDFTGDTSSYFKVMADYYSNLGTMVGFDGAFKPGTALTSLKVNLELGFSNTVFESGTGLYYPYNSSGEIETDSSNFMSLKLPFRYQADLEMEISTPLSLKLSLPVYSDPYFDWDFNQRAETMDWIDYMMSGGQSDSDEDDATTTGDFNWTLTGSYSFKVSEIVKPFISSASISSFSSSIKYSTKTISSYTGSSTSPERSFYYPSQITPFKISGKISGTIFEYPSSSSSSASSPSKVTLNVPEILDNSEKKTEEAPSEETAGDDKKTDVSITVENIEEEKKVLDESALPVIATPSFTVQKISGLTYKLSYSVSPDFTSQISYDSSSISTPEDFSWSDMQSTYYQVKAPATLTSSLGLRDGFLSLSDTFTFNPVYQEHPYIKIKENDSDSGYTESAAQNVKKTDYSARKLDLTDVNAVTLKPFYYTEHFSDTSLTWNTTVKMIRTKYVSDDVENPEWEYLTTDLTDEECLTVHNLNLKLAAKEGNYNQSLTLTTTLPPQVDSYSGTISFGFPYATLSATTGIKQKSSTDDTWVKQDFSESFSLNLFSSKLKLTQSYIYDLEDWYHESLKFSMSGFGAQLAYTMSYTTGYEFDVDEVTGRKKGWVSTSEKEFRPYSLSFAYTTPSKTFKHMSDKISWAPSLSTSFVYDYVRPTNTYFVFIPKLTFKVNDFIDISFSAETRNSSVYRYFCSEEDYDFYYSKNGERNFLTDLADSFRFDDEEKRKSSGFKLKSLNIEIKHDLDDWELNCNLKISPRYVSSGTKPYYDFSPYFSISVAWRPLAGMKTEIVDEYGTWELNP